MAILLRIALTPIAFALVSRAQTRFGDRIGGRLIGLPLTTGPFLLTVCLTESRTVAARAAAGVTSGQMAVVVFCCGYGCLARRLRPLQATAASLSLALASVLALSPVAGPWSAATAVWLVIAASLVFWPWPAERADAAETGAEDEKAGLAGPAPVLQRAVISTVMVATMSTLVPVLGPQLAGVITSAPILLTIILPSTHRRNGAAGAAALARGTIVSMAATVAFSVVLSSSLPLLSATAALLLSAAVLCLLVAATVPLDRCSGDSVLSWAESVL
jgi:hypothetical protein